jgi:SWI/SNF-related matrix-associated actin-dependent regulator 1 of chromatin subfamily A
MAGKRPFKRVPVWQKPQGAVISLLREGALVRLDFEYSPARVAAVKAIKGARYHPSDKSWTIPFASVDSVLTHKEFPAHHSLNGLGERGVTPLASDAASAQLRKNPFCVPEEALAAVGVDVVVRMNLPKRRLRIIPRVGSTALKVVKKAKGATYCAADAAYTVPVERFPELLKKFRDKEVAFAVDQTAGKTLSSTAPLRNDLVGGGLGRSSKELTEACLVPFITEVSDSFGEFRPCYFTAEQFKAAFPTVSRRGGSSAPLILDARGLLAFVARMDALPFSVWLTDEVRAEVERSRERLMEEISNASGPIDDAAADVVQLPFMWRTAPSGRGLLAISLPSVSEARRLVADRIGEVLGTSYESESDALHIEIPDSRLSAVISEVSHLSEINNLGEIPRSASFVKLEADVRERIAIRERGAFYASLEDVPSERVSGLEIAEAQRLFPHQRVAIEWLKEFPTAFLGDDMGLGKTLSVLSFFATLQRTEGYELLLVVCPNSLTRNWVREATTWFPHMKATVLTGDKGEKAWTLRLLTEGTAPCDVFVANYEGVRLDYVTPELAEIVSKRKTLLCVDESQRVKNHQAKTFKALSTIAPHCNRRVLLSGTPTPKDVTDLWAQMKLLDGGKRFGRSFYKWLGTVAELGTEYSEFAVKKFHEHEVHESIYRAQEIMLRRRKERVIDLPAKTFSLREIELSGSQRERYDEIREGLILRMRSTSGEQFVREITNILEEYLRAVQVASNPRLIDPEWKGDPAKFLELDEIVTEVVREQGQKVVIWTNYLGNIRELVERYKDLGAAPFSGEVSAADREKTVRAFQTEDTPKILVAVPAAGGVGITLTAAQTAVYIDKTWNAEHWMQSVDRIHRIGQRGTVNVISLLSCKVDEMIHWNLRRKEQGQADVLGDNGPIDPSLRGAPTRKELLEALEVDL